MQFAPIALKDLWLSAVNPLRGLTMSRVIAELEAGERGDYATLQWLYRFIEKRDATLRGAKRRLLSSVKKLEWDVKIRSGIAGKDKAAAEKQQAELKAAYSRIGNLRAAIGHLALAEFRGYAHLEKRVEGGDVVRLEPVPQWFWCRDGLYGEWKFLADATKGGISGTPIEREQFIIREIDDPINEIAAVCFTRKGLSQKDFDSFVARYGIPFVFWILSDAMAAQLANEPEKLAEWMHIMRGIGSDGEGIIPGGTLQTLDAGVGGKDNNPFLQHTRHQDEQIVMAATSGKLTMLNDATGLGSGNAKAHEDTFDEIAQALAMEISETFQEQFDAAFLSARFPGAERLVYFELSAKDAEDVAQLVDNAKKLSDAGYEMDAAQLAERSGYKLATKAAQDPSADPDEEARKAKEELPPAASRNREKGKPPAKADDLLEKLDDGAAAFISGGAADLAGLLFDALQPISEEP